MKLRVSIDTLLSTDESLEEIKERIAQERIDEIDKEKDQAIKEEIKNGEENSDEQAQEDIIDAELTDEQKEVEKKANNKEGDIIISLFGLGLIAYLIIGSFTNDWTWGWVLPVMGLFGAGMVTGLYSERHFSILSLAFIAVLFIMALKYALESNANVYYIVIASISISSFFILSIVRFIFFIIFEYKNRENLELIYHKKRLIEERNKYLKMEEAYEKYKKELGKIKL